MMSKLFGLDTLKYAVLVIVCVLFSHLDTKEQLAKYRADVEWNNKLVEEIMDGYEIDIIEEHEMNQLFDKLHEYFQAGKVSDFKIAEQLAILDNNENLFQE